MKPRNLHLAALLAGAFLALGAQPGMAQTGGGSQGTPGGQDRPAGQRPPGPPAEAIAACQGKASGATCSFTGRRNDTVSGTCFAPPAGGPGGAGGANAAASGASAQGSPPLACRPARGGPGKAGEK